MFDRADLHENNLEAGRIGDEVFDAVVEQLGPLQAADCLHSLVVAITGWNFILQLVKANESYKRLKICYIYEGLHLLLIKKRWVCL